MNKLEALCRRLFCETITYYGEEKMELGHVHLSLKTQNIEYVYVGKSKLWINKTNI